MKRGERGAVYCASRGTFLVLVDLSPYFYFSGQIYRSFTHSCSSTRVALGEIGECPLGFPLGSLGPPLSFSLYSPTIQDFCPARTSISFQPGCYIRGTTCGKYKNL